MPRFPDDYSREELAKLVLYHRDKHTEISTKLSNLKEQHIRVSKELSALKRSKSET